MRSISLQSVLVSAAALVAGMAATSALHGAVIVSSSGNVGSTAIQLPIVVAASQWSVAYDPSTPSNLVYTSSSVPPTQQFNKGLYSGPLGLTVNPLGTDGTTDLSWANTAGTGASPGIQILLPHAAGTAAVLGLGALTSAATFDPANVGGDTTGIHAINLSMGARQTGTSDKSMVAGLLLQGGKYYRTAWTVFQGTAIPAIASPNVNYTGLTASSFGEITIARLSTTAGATNFGSNPDFSPAGGVIKMGFLVGYDSSLGTAAATNRVVVNSWTISVPEPASLAVTGLGAMLLKRRRR